MSKDKTAISKAARALAALGAAPLSIHDRRRLARMVDADGLPAVAQRLGLGTGTIARALGGLGLRRATVTVITAGLPVEEGQVRS